MPHIGVITFRDTSQLPALVGAVLADSAQEARLKAAQLAADHAVATGAPIRGTWKSGFSVEDDSYIHTFRDDEEGERVEVGYYLCQVREANRLYVPSQIG